jgi:hypothetical protein
MLNALARDQFLWIGKIGGGDLTHHLAGLVAQHALGAGVEDLDYTLLVRGDMREIDISIYRVLQRFNLDSGVIRHRKYPIPRSTRRATCGSSLRFQRIGFVPTHATTPGAYHGNFLSRFETPRALR